uniref:Cement protein KRSR n=1 Tax=Pectinaria gouldii TaxID=260746 RepID=A0A0K1P3E8_PECGU|nr:cement protein KRSR [Pectinaria gouldii]
MNLRSGRSIGRARSRSPSKSAKRARSRSNKRSRSRSQQKTQRRIASRHPPLNFSQFLLWPWILQRGKILLKPQKN